MLKWVSWLFFLGIASALPWLFPDRWTRHMSRQSTLLNESYGCETTPLENRIEVSEKNARLFETRGSFTALSAASEGCFHTRQALPLYAITRNRGTREITSRRLVDQASISLIIGSDFKNLLPAQQKYVARKFGGLATEQVYNLMTVERPSGSLKPSGEE